MSEEVQTVVVTSNQANKAGNVQEKNQILKSQPCQTQKATQYME